jgi:hypothetical protein
MTSGTKDQQQRKLNKLTTGIASEHQATPIHKHENLQQSIHPSRTQPAYGGTQGALMDHVTGSTSVFDTV